MITIPRSENKDYKRPMVANSAQHKAKIEALLESGEINHAQAIRMLEGSK